MSSLITELSNSVPGPKGSYKVRVHGRERKDKTWEGWLEFVPDGGGSAGSLVTDSETSQPNRPALEYWASGLEQIYLDGALKRAKARTSR